MCSWAFSQSYRSSRAGVALQSCLHRGQGARYLYLSISRSLTVSCFQGVSITWGEIVPWGWGNVQWVILLGAFFSWHSQQVRDGSVGPGKQPWVEHHLVTIQLGPGPLEYSSVGWDGGWRQRKGATNREGRRRLRFRFYILHSFSQVRPQETRP